LFHRLRQKDRDTSRNQDCSLFIDVKRQNTFAEFHYVFFNGRQDKYDSDKSRQQKG